MDNFYKQYPPMMSDGRMFTDFRTNVRINEYIKYINGIDSNEDYRLFLQNNAEKIMDNQWEHDKKNHFRFTNDCIHNYPTRMDPRLFVEERRAANSLFNPNRNMEYKCQKFNDYRASVTNNSKQ